MRRVFAKISQKTTAIVKIARSEIKLKSPSARLAIAYVAILVCLSLVLSFLIYQFAGAQLEEGLKHQFMHDQPSGYYGPGGANPADFDPDQIVDQLNLARHGLILDLVYFNVFVLLFGTILSYWLARRTVRPIEEALEAQSRFTSDASHQLRTPLAVMRTGIETAVRDPGLTKTEAVSMLDSNLEEVVKLQSLAEGLLRLARADGRPLPMGKVSLEDVTSQAVNRVIKQIKQKEIVLVNDASEIFVTGDEQSLVELIVILLDNAIKYSEPKQVVKISSQTHDKTTVLKVEDSGRGIPKSDLEHIFDRFYRVDRARSGTDVEGHGLGLSIAKNIADLHNAKITVLSSAGSGSSFQITFPLT